MGCTLSIPKHCKHALTLSLLHTTSAAGLAPFLTPVSCSNVTFFYLGGRGGWVRRDNEGYREGKRLKGNTSKIQQYVCMKISMKIVICMPKKILNINHCDIPSNKKKVKCIQNVYIHNSSLGSYLDILFKMFIILFIFFILTFLGIKVYVYKHLWIFDCLLFCFFKLKQSLWEHLLLVLLSYIPPTPWVVSNINSCEIHERLKPVVLTI